LNKKLIRFGTTLLSGVLITTSLLQPGCVFAAANPDYATAFKDSIIFYDANKCGKDAGENNAFSWRGACHTSDGSDVGVDLSGGYHDAGDHVKFGITEGYAASVLAWSLYEFKDAFDATGNTAKMNDTLKHFTDYFLKSHPNSNVFYYQVGNGDEDHAYWGAPEKQTAKRTTLYKADANNPASDVLGETSAALALMYLNYKGVDSAYADKCLAAAKELYSMGKSNRGVGKGQSFYVSSNYGDDMAWAGVWLYTATKDSTYLSDAEQFITLANKIKDNWTMSWDNMHLPAVLRLYQITGKQLYKDGLDFNFNYWKNQIPTTPGGLKYLTEWGVLRYTAAESMVALVYCKQDKDQSLLNLAKSQLDYILGNNPANMSYMIGFGNKWCVHPHHRAANGYTYDDSGNLKPAQHVLTGALVGGPNKNDTFNDDGSQYQFTEVAIDYNAGLVGALAGAVKFFNGIPDVVVSYDLNGDKNVDALDLACLKKYLLTQNSSGINLSAADMNKDGAVNALDYALLKKYLLTK
jgi:hypothetical protein